MSGRAVVPCRPRLRPAAALALSTDEVTREDHSIDDVEYLDGWEYLRCDYALVEARSASPETTDVGATRGRTC